MASNTQNSLVVLVTLQKGKKFAETGEVVGTYIKNPESRKRWSRHIVFLPNREWGKLVPDEEVRVSLQEIREDSSGYMMYRGIPAPVDYTDEWRDNGDGTLSRVTVSTNWLLQRADEGVVETRPKVRREGNTWTTIEYAVVWGSDMASSEVMIETLLHTPTEEESVGQDGQLTWTRVGERQDSKNIESHAITAVSLSSSYSEYLYNRLDPTQPDSRQVSVAAQWVGESRSFQQTWAEMPSWWKAEQEGTYPLCLCARQRIDSGNILDGYTRCETCRDEEICDRCQKQPVRITMIGGVRVCSSCEHMARQEELVQLHLPQAKREELARKAARLLAGQALEATDGEQLLEALLPGLGSSAMAAKKGYPWYYVTDQGIFGSKFSPEALQIVAILPQAAGDGLVRLAAWVAGGRHKVVDYERYGDFYYHTQVKGKEKSPDLGEASLRQANVAELLCGSLADRQQVLDEIERFATKLGEDDPLVAEVRLLIQQAGQDYGGMLRTLRDKMTEFDERLRQRAAFAAELEQLSTELGDQHPLVTEFRGLPGKMGNNYPVIRETMRSRLQEEEERIAHERHIEAFMEEASKHYDRAVVYVSSEGDVFVCCGKTNRMGDYSVFPEIGEMNRYQAGVKIRVTPDKRGRESAWQQIPTGRRIRCESFSRSGKLVFSISFTVPTDLAEGMWGVYEEDGQDVFFTMMSYIYGKEHVPDQFLVIRPVQRRMMTLSSTAEKGSPSYGITWEYVRNSKREFRHTGCRGSVKLTGGQWKQGTRVERRCLVCGQVGVAHNPGRNDVSQYVEPPQTAVQAVAVPSAKNGGEKPKTDLSKVDLSGLFGGRGRKK